MSSESNIQNSSDIFDEINKTLIRKTEDSKQINEKVGKLIGKHKSLLKNYDILVNDNSSKVDEIVKLSQEKLGLINSLNKKEAEFTLRLNEKQAELETKKKQLENIRIIKKAQQENLEEEIRTRCFKG